MHKKSISIILLFFKIVGTYIAIVIYDTIIIVVLCISYVNQTINASMINRCRVPLDFMCIVCIMT